MDATANARRRGLLTTTPIKAPRIAPAPWAIFATGNHFMTVVKMQKKNHPTKAALF
jgi:hypothetical protein